MNPIQPLQDFVVVLPEEETTSSGGIIIPDKYRKTSMWGTAIAVGPGKWSRLFGGHIEPEVKAGMRVMTPAFAARTLLIDGVSHKVFTAEEIILWIEPTTESFSIGSKSVDGKESK